MGMGITYWLVIRVTPIDIFTPPYRFYFEQYEKEDKEYIKEDFNTLGCIFDFGCVSIFIQSSYYCHNAVLDSKRLDNINDKEYDSKSD